MFFLTTQNNSYPMREWHVEHMQKTIVKFVMGLSDNASSWQKRQHKKYNNLTNDMEHGVTNEEVFSFFNKVRSDPSFSSILENVGSVDRLDEVEKQLMSTTTANARRF